MEQRIQLLDVPEAARQLNVKATTVRAWIQQRRLPYIKLGRRVLLDPEDVQRFVEAGRVEAISVD